MFTGPVTNGRNYSTIAFENDMPGFEVQGAQLNPPFCDPNTGANCVNPPSGAAFYPFYSTTFRQGECTWQEGWQVHPAHRERFRRQFHGRIPGRCCRSRSRWQDLPR